MDGIKIDNLSKKYIQAKSILPVFSKIDLTINSGEFITFFGPNGCGKTTLIKVIAGIETPSGGKVNINSLNPQQAKVGVIFQNFADSLMPWLNGYDNILFPYHLKRHASEITAAEERLRNWLCYLKINLPLSNYPYQMSGGQQQLISILRTLIYKPAVILMDEPFSALDYQTRLYMQSILLDLWSLHQCTILFISHDIEEAIFLADRLILLNPLPTSIKAIYNIPFGRPRTQEITESKEFLRIKFDCLHTITGRSF